MLKELKVKVQQRYNDSSMWERIDPVLEAGEVGIESNTGRFKYGDGKKPWSKLEYAFGNGMVSMIYESIDDLPSAKDYPGAIAIVPQYYVLEEEKDDQGNVIQEAEEFWMDTPYLSLRKGNRWYWTIFADQKDKPIASSALDYFQLNVSTLG